MKDLDKPAENLKAKSSEESSLHMNLQVQQLAQLLEAKRKKIHLEQKIKEAREELEKTENEIKTLVAALNAVGINADNWDLGSK